jgi:hypothetical protein
MLIADNIKDLKINHMEKTKFLLFYFNNLLIMKQFIIAPT